MGGVVDEYLPSQVEDMVDPQPSSPMGIGGGSFDALSPIPNHIVEPHVEPSVDSVIDMVQNLFLFLPMMALLVTASIGECV